MDLGLAERVAVVGASSRGLGRAIAAELAAAGASLMLCARTGEPLEQARAELQRTTGADVRAIVADLARPGESARVVEKTIRHFGKVDVLVTNTGGPPAGAFEDHTADTWRTAYTLLIESVLEQVRAALPGMRERGWGRIITITSIAVKQPVDGLMLSNSLRAAVAGFARTLANEVAAAGITVNNVMPGYTRTERVIDLARRTGERLGIGERAAYEHWEREIPMGRIAEPREVAALVAFLASERASYITGTSIPVDGGWIRSLL